MTNEGIVNEINGLILENRKRCEAITSAIFATLFMIMFIIFLYVAPDIAGNFVDVNSYHPVDYKKMYNSCNSILSEKTMGDFALKFEEPSNVSIMLMINKMRVENSKIEILLAYVSGIAGVILSALLYFYRYHAAIFKVLVEKRIDLSSR